jgi:hypothetical protein
LEEKISPITFDSQTNVIHNKGMKIFEPVFEYAKSKAKEKFVASET